MRRIAIFTACLLLVIFVSGSLFTPWSWKWGANNLQVRLVNKANERQQVGSFGCSVGWSKLSLFLGDWSRSIASGTRKSGENAMVDSSDFNIAWVTPKGVTVRVRHREKTNDVTTSFDKLIFIPDHESSRVEASPNIYLMGYWE